ncbi:MAG: hypothetical protein QOK28_739 [Actinomycetota bacterium]|jgi:hypothetical protein
MTTVVSRLWTDHVVWMREYVVATVDDRPDRAEVAARLLRTPADLGRAIEKAAGRKEGRRVAKALRQHVIMAIDFVDAACAENEQRYRELEAVWEAADQDEPWHRHIPLIKAVVTARMEENFDRDVEAFDDLLTMASDDAEKYAA